MEKKNITSTFFFSLMSDVPSINYIDNCIYLRCTSLKCLLKLKNILTENKDFNDLHIPSLHRNKLFYYNFKKYREPMLNLELKETRAWLIKYKTKVMPYYVTPFLAILSFKLGPVNFEKIIDIIINWAIDNNIYLVSRHGSDKHAYLESFTGLTTLNNKKSIFVEKDRYYKVC